MDKGIMIKTDQRKVLFLKEEYADGEGTFKYPEGGKYEGQWKNGKKYGWGIETLPCGEKYIGTWRHGKRNGKGVETFSDGQKYAGNWQD